MHFLQLVVVISKATNSTVKARLFDALSVNLTNNLPRQISFLPSAGWKIQFNISIYNVHIVSQEG